MNMSKTENLTKSIQRTGGKPMSNALLNRILNPEHVPPAHAVILARVSSAEQREGKSLKAQEFSAREYCKRKQMIVERVYSFTESSTKGERKQFHQMMDYVKQSPHPIAIVADTLDRFQRSFKESLEFEPLLSAGKFELHFISNNMIINKNSRSSERMMYDFGVMGAKSYVDQLRENVLRGFTQKIKEQEYPSKAPVGYRNVKKNGKSTIEQDPDTAPLVRKLFVQYATGNYPIKAAARDFCSAGIKSIHGTPFSVSSVHRILDNPFYYGQMRIGGYLFPHKYKPIISEELFRRCQRIRKGLSSHPFDYATKPFTFRGLLRCKHCGAVVTSYEKHKAIKSTGAVHTYHYLRCSGVINKRGCKADQVNEIQVERQVLDSLRKLTVDPRLLNAILTDLNKENTAEIEALQATETALKQRLGQINKTRSVLIGREINGDLDSSFVSAELSKLKEEEQNIQTKLAKQDQNCGRVMWTLERLLKLASKAADLYIGSNTLQKNALLRCIYSNCKLSKEKLEIIMKKPFQLMLEGLHNSKWSGRRDSNPRPHGPEPCALPSALRPVNNF